MTSDKWHSDNIDDIYEILQRRQVRPTANRIIIFRELLRAESPLSMSELEDRLETIDKSGLSRTLGLFSAHHIVHIIEDGSGAAKYEACHGHVDHSVADMHPHFHCEVCGSTLCLYDTPIPAIPLPKGYEIHAVNYMIKGVCDSCARKAKVK